MNGEQLSPVIVAQQRLSCVDPACAVAIEPGEPIVLFANGWSHAVHVDGVQ